MPAGPYRPQLDGLRAIAISLVVVYHLGYLRGGWIGVDLFFVLSGYLITSLLLSQRDQLDRGGRALARFWGRRARRLLPAVLVMLAVVLVYAWVGGPGVVPAQLRAPALATTFYVANWQQIGAGHSYFAQFGAPSPYQHTWSLAIEEQYYLVWPLLLALLIRSGRTRPHRTVVLVGALAVASMVWMGMAAHVYGANRAYLGTDTRAWELLGGAVLALLWPSDQQQPGSRKWSAAAMLGMSGVAAGAVLAGGPPEWVWDGGLVAIAVCGAVAIVGTVRYPCGLLARFLSKGPIRWLGLISYSLYLWHWPVIVLLSADNTGLSGAYLLVTRIVVILVAGTMSFYVIENPLRRADWGRLAMRLRVPTFGFWSVGVVGASLLALVATVGPARAGPARLAASAAPDVPSPQVQPGLGRMDVTGGSGSDPLRVWLFGDSVMADASPGIQAAVQATGAAQVVANTSFGGWGLSTDRGWPADTLSTIQQAHPQVAIGTWSWDDGQAEEDPAAYTLHLQQVVGTLLSPQYGIQVVALVEFPQVGPREAATDPSTRAADWARQSALQDAWDAAARRAVEAFPGRAVFLTTDRLFAPGGRFFTWFPTSNGGWVRARKLDNTHFCPFGAAEFGQLVTNDLSELADLPSPTPGWELGAWTHDPRYDDPPGACPDDQPSPHYAGLAVPG